MKKLIRKPLNKKFIFASILIAAPLTLFANNNVIPVKATLDTIAQKLDIIIANTEKTPAKLGGFTDTLVSRSCGTGNGTTTLTYVNVSDSASTTLGTSASSCIVERFTKLRHNILVKSTTSPATLMWEYQYSDNNVDWYGEDGNYPILFDSAGIGQSLSATTSQSTIHSTTSPMNFWNIRDTATNTKSIIISNPVSKFIRVRFHIFGNNGIIYSDIIGQ